MEDWFKWALSGLVGLYSAVTGFVIGLIIHDRKRIGELDSRLAVIEARPFVDPVEHAEAMASLRSGTAQAAKDRAEMLRILRSLEKQRGLTR